VVLAIISVRGHERLTQTGTWFSVDWSALQVLNGIAYYIAGLLIAGNLVPQSSGCLIASGRLSASSPIYLYLLKNSRTFGFVCSINSSVYDHLSDVV